MNRLTATDVYKPENICPTRVGMNRRLRGVQQEMERICPTRVGMNRVQ